MDYPTVVQIETATICNARCSFCPHIRMSRSNRDRMPETFFGNLVKEMASWDVHPKVICPFVTNEPLADPRLLLFCSVLATDLPKTEVILFTNGSLLTQDKIGGLMELDNVTEIHVSIHYADPAEYAKEMGLDHGLTVSRVKSLIAANQKSSPRKTITFIAMAGTPEKDEALRSLVRTEFGGLPLSLGFRWNYKGDILGGSEPTPDRTCDRLQHMVILCNGIAALCCMDQDAKHSPGNANTMSLLDIFNSAEARWRRSAKKSAMDPCRICNMRP